MRRLSAFNLAALILGIGFLYLPIVILVVYSFNASRLVAVWGGWSLRWYVTLAQDAALLHAASISFRVALVSACVATFLGTLAAIALVRFCRLTIWSLPASRPGRARQRCRSASIRKFASE